MKTQLTLTIVILNFLMGISLFGQNDMQPNPLQKAVSLLYKNNCISYDAEYHMKSLMEKDTNISLATVKIKKDTSRINYIDIKDYTNHRELVFINDSAWILSLNKDTMLNLGTGMKTVQHSGLSSYYLTNLILVDSSRSENPRIFPVTRREGELAIVPIPITEMPEGIDSANFEIYIDTTTSLIRRIKSVAYFHFGDFLYQDLLLSNFEFPPCDDISIPEEFNTFKRKDLASIKKAMDEKPKDTLNMLEGLVVHDLKGNQFEFPRKGLIFLDLWYVGCFPCMKSAPHIENLYQKYKDRIHFYSLNEVDRDTSKILLFEKKMGISFPVLIPDKKGYFGSKLNNNGYPHFLILDAATGNLLWDITGFSEDIEDIISEELEKRL